MRNPIRLAVALTFAGALAAACGPAVLRDQHTVKFSTGGRITYALGQQEPLPGVLVTLSGAAANATPVTATTDSEGLWTIGHLDPGVYAARYELAGYETVTGSVTLDAFGANQVSNPFIAAGDVQMNETRLKATISPFGTSLLNGETVTDGFGGNVLVYSVAADAAITVTFPRRVDIFGGGGQVRLDDTNNQITATLDSSGTIFTFTKAAIDNMGGGGPILTDNNPYTFAQIRIQNVQSFTPIHGDPDQMSASVFFNAIP